MMTWASLAARRQYGCSRAVRYHNARAARSLSDVPGAGAMYQSSDKYPFVRPLEENWQGILAEYRAVAEKPEMHAWPEGSLYDGRWDTYGLYGFGQKQHENCARCPLTTRLVEAIPGMVMAGFSRLA